MFEAKTKASANKNWNNDIACVCPHCSAKNWIANRSNFWICWSCERDLEY